MSDVKLKKYAVNSPVNNNNVKLTNFTLDREFNFEKRFADHN